MIQLIYIYLLNPELILGFNIDSIYLFIFFFFDEIDSG